MSEELEVLKERAVKLNIDFHPSIGLEKLKAKVNAELSDKVVDLVTEAAPEKKVEYVRPEGESEATLPPETRPMRDARLRREAAKLVRVRITCMNPNKREWDGEIFTVSNAVVGTFKNYVPFNADDGWHVPTIVINAIRDRKCQIFFNKVDSRGNKSRQGKLVNEFNVEELDPLTPQELQDLAKQQAMANAID